ncbi:MAG TPA: hemerythrin domain-containing protein [Terriglobia bacterium]|nr:hemerythrin domain-containing protein [Terriglobia bacterium]
MKVTLLLRNDHDAIKSLFSKYKKAGARNQNGKKELFEAIRRELTIHSQMETEIFYPALTGTSSKTASQLVSAAADEHDVVDRMLEEIGAMSPMDRNFDSRVEDLIKAVDSHIEKEELEIFDEARKTLPEHRLEELGLEMEDRKKILGQLAA